MRSIYIPVEGSIHIAPDQLVRFRPLGNARDEGIGESTMQD